MIEISIFSKLKIVSKFTPNMMPVSHNGNLPVPRLTEKWIVDGEKLSDAEHRNPPWFSEGKAVHLIRCFIHLFYRKSLI